MGPHVSDSGGVKLGSNRVKQGQTGRRLDAGEARDGGAARKAPTGHGRGRSWAHWRALAGARRMVVVAGPVVTGVDGGELFHGRRSSGGCGVSAAACKQTGYRARVALRNVASATDARAGPFGRRSHGGDELMRRRASGTVASLARARNRARE